MFHVPWLEVEGRRRLGRLYSYDLTGDASTSEDDDDEEMEEEEEEEEEEESEEEEEAR